MSPTRLSRDGSHDSPHRDGSPSKYTDVSGGSGGNQGHHRFILTKPRGRPPRRKQVKPSSKKEPSSSYFNEANRAEIPRRGSWEGSRETLGSKKDPGYQNTLPLGSGREEANKHDDNEEEKGTKRRPAWDNSVNVDSPLQPKINLRKYENELTFKPSITTKEEVYTAYTGHDRLYDSEDAAEQDEDRYSSLSSGEDASDRSRSNSRSPGRNKERILSKREARAYLKMTAVYGSDAFKNQRKQWFLDKLALAQDQKAKLEEEMRKAEEKKRVEDRKKQQRQLNYVRDKFRKEQVHRFRTQYVTSRVLEHEQANRHEYGLPEDFDDGTSPNNDNSKNSRSKAQASPSDEGKPIIPHTHLNGHSFEHNDNKPQISQNINGAQHRKEKQSRHGLKDVTSNNEPFNADNKKQQTQKNKEEEREKQRQEKQKSWYTAYERAPRSEETKPPYETSNSSKKTFQETIPLKTSSSNAAVHRKKKGTHNSEVRGSKNGTNCKEDNEVKSSFETENGSKTSNKSKDNNHSVEKIENGSEKDGYIKGNNSKNETGRIANSKHGDYRDANQARAYKGDKNINNKNKKDIGPSLPHTKSHADTDNSKEKNENAPYIFTGHFRQEADGTYHKLDTIEQDKNNLEHNKPHNNPSISNNEKYDNIKSSQPMSTATVLQTDKSGVTSAKNHDMVSSSAQRQMVQNLVNKATINSQTDIKDRHDSKAMSPHNTSKQLNQSNHSDGRNKHKISPTGHSDLKKSSNNMPAKPSAIALLHVLEEAKPPERKQSVHTSTSTAHSFVKPIPEKTTISNLQREERTPDRRSSKDVASKTVKKQLNQPKSLATGQGMNSRRATASSGRSTAAAAAKKKPQGNSTLAHFMFDANRGPSWDPHQKIPKMEGIDTVVIETKDGKGHVVKQKKHVKNVVKDAEKQLNVPIEDAARKRPTSKRSFKMASPDVTLGSDFDVDDDEEEAVGDIFERLRKKYNIQIDSDEED